MVLFEALKGTITALQNIIYLISNALLIPVMALLVGGVAFSLFELGRFVYEFIQRRKHPSRIEEIAWIFDRENATEAERKSGERLSEALKIIRSKGSSKLVHDFINDLERLSAKIKDERILKVQVEKLIQDYEEKVARRTEITRILVRVGPMLGLMGTLIPMGPALLALSQGDVVTLANNLIIAFGTTVLGLLIGGIAYMMTEVRNRWYDRDLSDIAYICEVLFGEE
ncbi:MAG: Biopolymer transport protein ExbB/TolQ [Methanophagales archaeon]|nr:MotA/TolQ/ExbB proton channel family protein [Methanophagales archaeon]MCU4140189.1 Biopolymer transport protein ExbB/TolQ [Methanophagales archaeon]